MMKDSKREEITKEEMLAVIKEKVTTGMLTREFAEIIGSKLGDSEGLKDFEVELMTYMYISQELAKKRSKKVKWGMKEKVLREGFISTVAPLGYKYNKEIGEHEIDCHSAMLVNLIYNLYLEGNGIEKIAKILDERGFNTPEEYTLANKLGIEINIYTKRKNWSPTSVRNILRNPIYIGKLVYGKTKTYSYRSRREKADELELIVIAKPELAIVTQEKFDEVQELFKRKLAS